VTTLAEVATGVRAAQSAYVQGLDSGRIDQLAAVFTEDAVVDIEGMPVLTGREAVREAYEGWRTDRPQRHVVANMLVTAFDDEEATATTDVLMTVSVEGAWRIAVVGRYTDTLRREDGTWRFSRRVTRFAS
jgi:uncharacterized protein (TIGR02246 family)